MCDLTIAAQAYFYVKQAKLSFNHSLSIVQPVVTVTENELRELRFFLFLFGIVFPDQSIGLFSIKW